ncbi:MAG: cation:proton antiporter [Ferruginibacter sp.]
MHLPHLILDLGLILGAAAVMTLLFKKLKQPLVLGYILAGILVSPNFTIFPSVIDTNNVQVWAELGIIFLLFSLGLEFSFKKLAKVGGSASVTALIIAVGMSVAGYFTAQLLGWNFMDSVFLGAMVSVSSTTIIIKSIEELGFKKKKFAALVFGVLVVEDLIAILLLVLLSTFAISREFEGKEMILAIFKLIFFLVLWFLLGIFFIPTILQRAKAYLNDESLLIASLALCLGMVYLATLIGFSSALGAFVMGSLLAETTKAEKIEHLIGPVKNLFGAVFFVSVGILINLNMLAHYIVPVLIISFVVVIGQLITAGTGTFISGNSLKTSFQTGMSLGSVGEFSFIIAGLGLSLKVTSDFLYPVIIAVSGITAFISPYFIRSGETVYSLFEKMLPEKWRKGLLRYSSEAQTITAASDWENVLKSFIKNVLVFSIPLIAIIYLTGVFLLPFIQSKFSGIPIVITIIVSLLLMAPFLWWLVLRNERNESFAQIYSQKKYRGPIWIMRGIKIFLAIFFIVFFINRFFSLQVTLFAAIIIFSAFFIFRKKIQAFYDRIENRFILNLNDRELQDQLKEAEQHASIRNIALAPWDAHLVTFDVPPESPVAGKKLDELQWREQLGVNIAKIERGLITKLIPGKDDRIYPGDKLYVICTDWQEKKLNAVLRPSKDILKAGDMMQPDVVLDKFTIEKDSPFLFQSIRYSPIKTQSLGLVVGIERDGKRILNPSSDTIFQENDVIWIVGEKKKVDLLT